MFSCDSEIVSKSNLVESNKDSSDVGMKEYYSSRIKSSFNAYQRLLDNESVFDNTKAEF